MGFEDLLDEPDRMLLDGERGHVSIATAKWGFEGRNASELSFPPGGVIRVLEPHESGWWTGEYRVRDRFPLPCLSLDSLMAVWRRRYRAQLASSPSTAPTRNCWT